MNNLFGVQGKNIVVAGACGDVGARVCNRLADMGARVWGVDVRPPANGALEERISFSRINCLDEKSVSDFFSVVSRSQIGWVDLRSGTCG